MPLTPGKSKAVFEKNISEFHGGNTFKKTAAKFGKKKADKQAVAVAFAEKRRTGKGHDGPCTKCGASLVGKGHDCSASMKKAGKGQATPKKVGKGGGSPFTDQQTEDSIYGEYPSGDASGGRTVNKYGGTVRRSGDSNRDDYRLRVPTKLPEPVGSGQSSKRVGKGQGPVPPDAMPKRKPKGAMPLPGAEKKVSRRHRPPMNRKPPMAAMQPPPPLPAMGGGPPGLGAPGGGGPPMGPPMLPGAGLNGTPGMAPPRPPMPGMGQARKKKGY